MTTPTNAPKTTCASKDTLTGVRCTQPVAAPRVDCGRHHRLTPAGPGKARTRTAAAPVVALCDTVVEDELDDDMAFRADRALSASAILFGGISASPTLHRIGALAAARCVKGGIRGDGTRGPGEKFENALASLLDDDDTQAAIAAEVIGALPGGVVPGLGRVKKIKWLVTPKGSRKGFDVVVETTTEDGAVRHDWVNVKRRTGKVKHADAVAQAAMLRVASGEDLLVGRRINVAKTIVQFAAGEKKIATSDYIIMAFQCDGKQLKGIHSQGLLSTLSGDKLALFLHPNRAVMQYITADSTGLPDDFDVNGAFWRTQIRTMKADDLRLHYVTVAEQAGLTPAQVEAVAQAVLATDDKTMFAIAIADLEKICPDLYKA